MPARDDDALIAVLNTAAETMRPLFDHQRRELREDRWLPRPNIDGQQSFRMVAEALSAHREFREGPRRVFGGKQLVLHPSNIAWPLLPVACDRGAAAAIEWLRRVSQTTHADVRYISEVYGLMVKQPIQLSNGLRLIPLDQIPPSPNAQALKSQFDVRPGLHLMNFSPPSIAIFDRLGVPDDGGVDGKLPDEVSVAVRGFTLVQDAAPVIGMSWTDFIDPELQLAEFGRLWMPARFEGLRPSHPITVDEEAVAWAESFLRLRQTLRGRCDIAVRRLNAARRRADLADRAIEVGIGLEALFGDDSPQELTYKLRLRAALYLAETVEERRQISKDVNELYKLRSKAVHGKAVDADLDGARRAVVERGVALCASALQKMVAANVDYEPDAWEFSGGFTTPPPTGSLAQP